MKKLIIATIFLLATGFTAFGQDGLSVRTSVLEYLQAEGFTAEVDEDDDLVFTNNDYSYIVYVDDMDSDGFYYIRLVSLFKIYDMPGIELLRIANEIHNNYKLVTVYFSENDDESLTLAFETGCFVITAAEFNKVLKRHVSCIESGMEFFFNYNIDEAEDEEDDSEENLMFMMPN